MALLLETTLGDLVIDLDIEGSPELCKNVLKLAKARYYTSNLVYNIQANRFCQFGDPFGDGTGGACLYGLMQVDGSSEKVLKSHHRFLKSDMGRPLSEDECREKGRVVATEMNGVPNTLGSQILITIAEGSDKGLDGFTPSSKDFSSDARGRPLFRSLGVVTEDANSILDQLASTYCDPDGRPYADIRIIRALVIDDPFDDPPELARLMQQRGILMDENSKVTASPDYEKPPEERVELRISADQIDMNGEEDLEKMKQKEEELLKRQDKSRAVVLEMLGDLPSADIKAPENVLFVCKLNPVTEDEDLELIFSRFDEQVKAEIIRDPETGKSLQYAFVEFSAKQQAVEAYFKMNNALVDDRRIKVDFSQSVAKVWNKYSQRAKTSSGKRSNVGMPRNATDYGFQSNNNGRDGRRNHSRGGHPDGTWNGRGRQQHHRDERRRDMDETEELDQFGRKRNWKQSTDNNNRGTQHSQKRGHDSHHNGSDKKQGPPHDRKRMYRRSRSRDRHGSSQDEPRHGHHRRRNLEKDDDDGPRFRDDRRHNDDRRGHRHHERNHGKNGSRRDRRDSRERSPRRHGGSSDDDSYDRKRRERKREERKGKSRRMRDDPPSDAHDHRENARDSSEDSRQRKHSRRSRRHDSESDDDEDRKKKRKEDKPRGGTSHKDRHRRESRDGHDRPRKHHRDGKKSKRHRDDRDDRKHREDRKRRKRSRSRSAS